ncbi:Emp47p PWA37_005049 [Arxiozyma heterogenica]|uniref:L-type lectin-like domain-containing protein n=1 Tax=Arxiozyma heterogenica TaxID=278026 RepID=A0AAN8A779_9SACH|nr:hypothetical protein RI543_005072 [Kazachstania heterogenica]
MKLSYYTGFLAFLSLGSSSYGHNVDSGNNKNEDLPVIGYSLPNLITSGNSIPSNWETKDSAKLDEGRFILTPSKSSKGSLWLRPILKDLESFTVEWTFRSLNYQGKHSGGLSFWFLGDVDKIGNDQKLFNGPSKFNGLQLLVDSNSQVSQSIHAQLNDGSKNLLDSNEKIYDKSFASCLMGYQDSTVPLTLRLSYDSESNNMLKLQVDNKVCFQTRKIKLSNILQKGLKIGVSADNSDSLETFEILQMKFYNKLIEDALIPNVNAMNQPKLLTKIIDEKTGTEKIVDKEVLDSQNKHMSSFELYKKMDRLEGKIMANDINIIEEKINNILSIQQTLIKELSILTKSIQNNNNNNMNKGGSNDNDQFKDFLSMNEKLEKMLNEQAKIREATKLAQANREAGPQIDEIVSKLAVWLIPLIVIMCVMAYYTFKIRQEIVKTKLL